MSASEVGGARADVAPHRGVLVLIMGILSWMVCPFFGIVAWVMGNTDLAEMRAGRMDRSGEAMTQIGKIIGIVSVILNVFAILIVVVLFALGMGSFFMVGKAHMDAPVERNDAPQIRIEQQMPPMPKAPEGGR